VIQLSKEESIKWFSRNFRENPLEDTDGLFEEDEDEIANSGGLAISRWLVNDSPASLT
jgi:hypothetical protein